MSEVPRRNEFMIYVVDDEQSIRDVLKEALSLAGYQVELFPDAEVALTRIMESPPHAIISDIRMPGMSGIQLLEKVHALSSEIGFVVMTSHASLDTAVTAIKLGAHDYIYKPFENLSDVVRVADNTVERVFLRMENDQLLSELAEKNKELSRINQVIAHENKEIHQVNSLMEKLSQTFDPDIVIQSFLDSVSEICGGKPALFLKLNPSNSTLKFKQASISLFFDNQTGGKKMTTMGAEIRSVGINLKEFQGPALVKLLSEPHKMTLLSEFVDTLFGEKTFYPMTFLDQGQPMGIIVILADVKNSLNRKLVDSFLHLTHMSFNNAMMTKRIHELAVKDPLTSLFNRRYFNEKLDEELARSQRTHNPLALIYLDIDHFKNYNDTNGHPAGDVIIQMVAQILAKTGRKTDVVARVGGEEFAVLCPHTSLDGARIRAEKIKEVVGNTKFPFGEKQPLGRVTVSLGVSEYPSTSGDAKALVASADQALYKVKQAGRNKVCLAVAPEGFKPEFEPVLVGTGIPRN